MTTPQIIALVVVVVAIVVVAVVVRRRGDAASGSTPPPAPPGGGDEPEAVAALRATGVSVLVVEARAEPSADDVVALVSAIDRFTEGASKLRDRSCRDEGGQRLVTLTLAAGPLRGTVAAADLDLGGLLPLLNGALAHGGGDRRLFRAQGDGLPPCLVFVDAQQAQRLADEDRLLAAEGFGPPDLDRVFAGAEAMPLGGPIGFVPGDRYTPTALAAEGARVAGARQGVVRVFGDGSVRELEGLHAKADAVCLDQGEVLAAAADARVVGIWAADSAQPSSLRPIDVDMGRIIALDRRAGVLAVGVRSRKANQCWVVVLDEEGGERSRHVLPYGALRVRCAPDGSHVAVALEGDGLRVFTVDGDEVVHHTEDGAPYALTWRRDGSEVACAFDQRGRTLRWSAGGGVRVTQHGVSALSYGPDGELARSFLDEVVLPDGRSLPVDRQVLELAWASSLWGTGDHGWVVELVG